MTLDFCQYGEAWRKRTTIIYQGVQLQSLAKLCEGKHGVCSRKGKQHLRLQGMNQHGEFLAKEAQPYPFQLTESLAQELSHLSASG